MNLKVVSRSEAVENFREAFIAASSDSSPVWARFLDLAPAGAAEFWVVFDDNTPVGRVGAALMPSHPGYGSVGFFEASHPEAGALLLRTAETWLKSRGMNHAVGPMCLNTWFPYRYRTDEDTNTFAWEPANPPQYPAWFADNGYETLEHYHTLGSDGLAGYAEKTKAVHDAVVADGFTFRAFDPAAFQEKDVPALYELCQVGFSENFLFEPIPLAYFRELYIPLAKSADLSYGVFCLSPQGKEVAFLLAFPDRGYLVLKSATVLPEFRGKGLSTALTHLVAKKGAEAGITRFISALVRTGNRSESYAKKASTLWEHRYALLSKTLH